MCFGAPCFEDKNPCRKKVEKVEFVEIPSSTHEFNIGAEVEVKGTKEFVEKT